MKPKILLTIFFTLLLLKIFSQGINSEIAVKLDTISIDATDDSLEFELLIFDAEYEVYLISRAKPIDFYSQSYYENWNWQYVISWNSFYAQALHIDIIDCYIDYFPDVDYGLEVNYELYYYFQFIEEKYNIKLIAR